MAASWNEVADHKSHATSRSLIFIYCKYDIFFYYLFAHCTLVGIDNKS